jgi:hypothetical protein
LPNGEGLFRFKTIEEAAAAFEEINSDYKSHCLAARRIAQTWFDARNIARRILDLSLGQNWQSSPEQMISQGHVALPAC